MFWTKKIEVILAEMRKIDESYSDLVHEREVYLKRIGRYKKIVRSRIAVVVAAEAEDGGENQ